MWLFVPLLCFILLFRRKSTNQPDIPSRDQIHWRQICLSNWNQSFQPYYPLFALQNPQFEYRISTQNFRVISSIQAASCGVKGKTIQRQRIVGGSISHRDHRSLIDVDYSKKKGKFHRNDPQKLLYSTQQRGLLGILALRNPI